MAAETIFDTGTTKNPGNVIFYGAQRFQLCLDLLYVVNFTLLFVTILLVSELVLFGDNVGILSHLGHEDD
jgi:hypothetical protein